MAEVVIMPKQGQSVESCIITELKKKTGDSVKKGDHGTLKYKGNHLIGFERK